MRIKILIFISLITFITNISAAIGCIDNSYHMQRPGDTKEYHYVHCDCPCENVINDRGKCMRCLHFGRPDRGEINALQKFDIVFR